MATICRKTSGNSEITDSQPKRKAIETKVGPIIEKDTESITIHIIKSKISSAHLVQLKQLAIKNKIIVSEHFNNDVTHIVTSLTSYDKILSLLKINTLPVNMELVTLNWLTDTFTDGKPVYITDRYRVIQEIKHSIQPSNTIPPSNKLVITEYECQRQTLLVHPNPHLTEALELLEKYYQYIDYKQGDTRALAFRQASCTIKALPRKVTRTDEVSCLHRIGKHSMRVIEEIIENGSSKEIDDIRKNEWFRCMELFTLVYGCGPSTADKWYNEGLRTIEDVKKCNTITLTETQKLGLLHFDNISKLIPRTEVEKITEIIKTEVNQCCPGASVEAVGGYRRGKLESHDVDLLLSHKDNNTASDLLETVIHHLQSQNMVIHVDMTIGQNRFSHVQNNHETSSQSTSYNSQGKRRKVKFDYLDKAFCILRLKDVHHSSSDCNNNTMTDCIRRVDLIVSPPEQYPYALVSWTGSKQFNRSLRRYSVKECNKTVTAHGIFDIVNRNFIKAESEKEVFDILKLDYLEPNERNC